MRKINFLLFNTEGNAFCLLSYSKFGAMQPENNNLHLPLMLHQSLFGMDSAAGPHVQLCLAALLSPPSDHLSSTLPALLIMCLTFTVMLFLEAFRNPSWEEAIKKKRFGERQGGKLTQKGHVFVYAHTLLKALSCCKPEEDLKQTVLL